MTTIRTEAELLALFVDNTSGLIEAVDARDFIVSSRIDDVATHLVNTNNPHAVDHTDVGSTIARWNASKLQGRNIDTTAPSNGFVLTWNSSSSKWVAQASGGVAGDDTEIQFNDGGLDGADPDLTWDKTGNILTITGQLKQIDGSEASGYVLVSDADGLSTWTDPTTLANADPLILTEQTEPSNPDTNQTVIWAEDKNGITIIKFKDENGFTVRLARDNYIIAKNDSGTIAKGKLVYISGASGNNALFDLAQADSEDTEAIGITMEASELNDFVRIMTAGLLKEWNTNSWNEGDALYLDPDNAGEIVNVKPTAPNYVQGIGIVTRKHGSQGRAEIDIHLIKLAGISGTLQPTDATSLNIRARNEGATTGNARGEYSVDLQTERSLATEVASGSYSVISGGKGNTASNQFSAVASGEFNSATGTHDFVGGGESSIASGGHSFIGGGHTNDASGFASGIASGELNTAAGNYSFVGGGYRGVADKHGQQAHAAGSFTADGDAQVSQLVSRRQTTVAGPTEFTLDGSDPGSSNRVAIPNNTTWAFDIRIAARNTGTDGENAVFKIFGGIKKDGTAGTTALVGSVDKTVKRSAADGEAAWDIDVIANATDGALQIQATGEESHTINWVGEIKLTEVAG